MSTQSCAFCHTSKEFGESAMTNSMKTYLSREPSHKKTKSPTLHRNMPKVCMTKPASSNRNFVNANAKLLSIPAQAPRQRCQLFNMQPALNARTYPYSLHAKLTK